MKRNHPRISATTFLALPALFAAHVLPAQTPPIPVDWEARIAAQGAKVKEALTRANPQWGKDYDGHINGARSRVAARLASIGRQLGDMPKPMEWVNNVSKLGPKQWRAEGGGGMSEQNADGKHCLHIRADGSAAGSIYEAAVSGDGRALRDGRWFGKNVDPGTWSAVWKSRETPKP